MLKRTQNISRRLEARAIRLPHIWSLTVKLALAFLCVGLLGAVLVAFFVGQRTQQAFGQFVVDRGRESLTTTLAEFYQTHDGWTGVEQAIRDNRPSNRPSNDDGRAPLVTLANASGTVIVSGGRMPVGTQASESELERASPIRINGATVGWLLNDGFQPRAPGTPEGVFLNRVMQALIYGSIGATVIALLLGVLLARTLTHPLRELTLATQALAQGALGQQVVVRSRDELGTLARSFNRMSVDLAQASTVRKQMTADIAHDLRTPLSVILGYTEALRDGKLPGTQDVFDTMYTEALHLQHLVDDLRTLSLADAGELPLIRQPVEPRTLLDRAAAAVVAQAQSQGIDVAVVAAPGLPLVDVDVERMAQVLGNLLNNALRYTPTGGHIRLATDARSAVGSGPSVVFSVQDTGVGIAAADVPHIFERFYRADSARQHDGSSGLGLAIVKSIVEAHGGTVSLESTLGQGTTFTITLPQS